ncbi:hypothetical protein CCAX7_63660 [Capsulimonas corticalis]|uniref:Uncharacterized protein n=1 Tax=Capsulimonas corticalis TaxID=2219043 RepID=A0A402CX21_9BACT|nr:hypothetical protein [Capsulimonas corticalis]BDI34315.1 hypothetical protein CCAX7_63660 [Capsulimonas corticalis]
MLKPLSQLPGNELVWKRVKLGQFEFSADGDVYINYRMKGLSKFSVQAEQGEWTFQQGNLMGTYFVVKDRQGNVVATMPWGSFKKTQVLLADGRILRLGYFNDAMIIMNPEGDPIVHSQEISEGLMGSQRRITLGKDARNYPELPFLIPLCNYMINRAMSEQGQYGPLAAIFKAGFSRFE